jgi:two-component system nitrogen regulation response regulator GlnG
MEDLPELATHFLRLFGTPSNVSFDAMTELKNRTWPGNVRELRNVLEHAAIVARGGPIQPEHLPPPAGDLGPVSTPEKLQALVRDWVRVRVKAGEPNDLYQKFLDATEPALVGETLRHLDGNQLAAAKWLGLARATVRKLMRKYDLLPESDTADED